MRLHMLGAWSPGGGAKRKVGVLRSLGCCPQKGAHLTPPTNIAPAVLSQCLGNPCRRRPDTREQLGQVREVLAQLLLGRVEGRQNIPESVWCAQDQLWQP